MLASLLSRIASSVAHNLQLVVGLVLLIWLWAGFATGTSYVLENQPPAEVAAVRLVSATLRPGERVVVRAPARIALDTASAIAHLVVPEQGQYVLTTESPPPAGTRVGTAGPYTLYRISP